MAKDRTNLNVTGFSVTAGEPTVSFGPLIVERKPPEKPLWQRFMDLNVSLAELLKLKQAAKEIGKQIAWEIGKGILGRRRPPEEAKQV